MIKIAKGIEHGYKNDDPIIVVTHSFTELQLRHIVKLATIKLGATKVLEAMAEADPTVSPMIEYRRKIGAAVAGNFGAFVCHVDGTQPGHYEHGRKGDAVEEAKRLAKGAPGKTVRVLRLVAEVQGRVTQVPSFNTSVEIKQKDFE